MNYVVTFVLIALTYVSTGDSYIGTSHRNVDTHCDVIDAGIHSDVARHDNDCDQQ